jgi:putative ABC transport system substrate-binding protein
VIGRRGFIAMVGGGLFAAPLGAGAQPAERAARIGYLSTDRANNAQHHAAFLLALRDLGHIEGRNLVIEFRDAEGKLDRLPALAAELVALNVEVIVAAAGTRAALGARHATRTIPIVFIAAGNPVTSGLVASLARPGGNATGSAALSPELASKWIELLRQAAPETSRVAVLWEPGAMGEHTDKDVLKQMEVATQALGLRLQIVEARKPVDIEGAFRDMTRAAVGAVVVLSTSMFASERRRLVDLAVRNRLPTIFGFRFYVDSGGLMSYGPDLLDLFRRAATYVDKILKGARPADLPVEQPIKFEMVINLKTAKELGLKLPPSLLQRADQVIE